MFVCEHLADYLLNLFDFFFILRLFDYLPLGLLLLDLDVIIRYLKILTTDVWTYNLQHLLNAEVDLVNFQRGF